MYLLKLIQNQQHETRARITLAPSKDIWLPRTSLLGLEIKLISIMSLKRLSPTLKSVSRPIYTPLSKQLKEELVKREPERKYEILIMKSSEKDVNNRKKEEEEKKMTAFPRMHLSERCS